MKKTLLIAAFAALSLSASAQNYYMVGANVDGHSWECGVPETMFTAQGDGVYVWKGTELGTGFKINDGTWDYELAAPAGAKLAVGEPFLYQETGDNISFADCSKVTNPVVTLNTVEGTILVEGTKEGQISWFFTGDFNDFAFEHEMTEIETGVFQVKNIALPEIGEFKVTTTGWGEQYGSPWDAPVEITPENLSVVLGVVGSTNACPFTLQPGTYDITWNYATTTVTFTVVTLDPTPDPDPDPDPNPEHSYLVTDQFVNATKPAKGAVYDVVLMQKSAMDAVRNAGATVNDLAINYDTRNFLVWDNTLTMTDATTSGIGFDGFVAEGWYYCLDVTNHGWSGAGIYFNNNEKVSWNENTRLRFSYRSNGPAPESVGIIIADNKVNISDNIRANIALGADFNDNGNIFKAIAPRATSDWQTLDISFADLKKLNPDFSFDYTEFQGNIFAFLAGGVEGNNICFDAIYFYTPASTTPDPVPDPTPGIDYYLIGSDVNGKSWTLAAPDAKFTYNGDGTYVWTGQHLGTSFMINDGTWDVYFGTDSENATLLALDTDYVYTEGLNLDKIEFDGFTSVENPTVILDPVNKTIRISGEPSGLPCWYFTGDFNEWSLDYEMTKIADNVFEVKNITLPEVGEFKIAQTDWATQYGSGSDNPVEISDENLSAVLAHVGIDNPCSFTLTPGAYDIVWDFANTTVSFKAASVGPDPDPDHVSLKVVTLNGMGISSKVAKGTAATVNFEIDSYWKVETLTLNGADVTSDIVGNSYTTPALDADAEVEVSVAYDGVLISDNPSGVTEVSGSEVTVNAADSSVLIKGLKAGDEVTVYDLTGRVIAAQNVSKDVLEIRLESNNCYIIRINDEAVKVKL